MSVGMDREYAGLLCILSTKQSAYLHSYLSWYIMQCVFVCLFKGYHPIGQDLSCEAYYTVYKNEKVNDSAEVQT